MIYIKNSLFDSDIIIFKGSSMKLDIHSLDNKLKI